MIEDIKTHTKIYLIYLDILGFETIANEIAKNSGFQVDKVRQDYLSRPIREKIERIRYEGVQISQGMSEIEGSKGSDSYILLFRDIQVVIEVFEKLTKIKIPHRDFGYIPLEIAMGLDEIDESISIEPINRTEIIKFLKNDIIHQYKVYHKEKHGTKIKETFVVLNKELYEEIGSELQCEKINENCFFVKDLNEIYIQCRVYEFLNILENSGSRIYDRIYNLYVPPVEYYDIKDILEKERIIFISGTPEFGKTYTAVRLMWEYYNKGYVPKWVKGEEEPQRKLVRERLENIERELESNHIIYFEDPFGKLKYEKRDSLEREIGTIIESVKNIDNVYIIITSREEVFKEFENEIVLIDDLKEFEKSLNIKKPSYDYRRRKDILLKWAEKERCKWLKDANLTKIVLDGIKEKNNLPTPLSIRIFVKSTKNITERDKLIEKMDEKSKETAKIFANEIKNMTDDKTLFLSILFTSRFKVEFVKEKYEELVKELNIQNAWEFERLLTWFGEDKINITQHISFSHPSYAEALEYVLIENGYATQINKKIFSKMLISLSKDDKAIWYVVKFIVENFDSLTQDIQNLLFRLSDNKETGKYISWAVLDHLDKLPINFRNKLLNKLSHMTVTPWGVTWSVIENFDTLPENVREELLINKTQNNKVAWYIGKFVVENFDKLTENLRNELLIRLSDREVAVWRIGKFVVENFDKLPEELREKLLIILSQKNEVSRRIGKFVVENSDKLTENVRNELLIRLSDREVAGEYVARYIIENFDKLPENVRNLLFKLSNMEVAGEHAARYIIENFNKLPENVRNLLFKLSDMEVVGEHVARSVIENFDKLPDNVRNELLIRLSNNEKAAWYIGRFVIDNFDKLPENLRNDLLIKLADKRSSAWRIAKFVVENFDKLPENVGYNSTKVQNRQ